VDAIDRREHLDADRLADPPAHPGDAIDLGLDPRRVRLQRGGALLGGRAIRLSGESRGWSGSEAAAQACRVLGR
jgi:hypothetical protein